MKFTAILLVDDVAGPFQWTRMQPPFSPTARLESST
jgi:hypothetical protein